ncbi:MAG: hypothetical protein A2452_13495 [Candidatus Firestonebacteria bacterium RIFOXYC2_FULL_39_67]|nr:MAG: hypothetical protein A2452_13495 [Candidatus Firestonebacteria bacterium RIFOXYC2_FULL_39_67]OGF57300.1 MAG: hypothetical protein A2497_03725 [Candidatus Firestonebacteria bacterium RifOxyC12_full_39_7]
MRILVYGAYWHGQWVEYAAEGLKRNGHIVEIIYWNKTDSIIERIINNIPDIKVLGYAKYKIEQTAIRKNVLKSFIAKIPIFKPDLIFVLGSSGNPISGLELQQIKKKNKVPIVCWYGDDPLRFYEFTRDILYYDYVFLGDPYSIDQINIIKDGKVGYLPGAVDETVYKRIKLSKNETDEYSCDISFVGSAYTSDGSSIYRASILSELAEYGMKIYGEKKWWLEVNKIFQKLDNAIVGHILTAEQANKLFNVSKIVMNIHHPQIKYATNIRTFEIAASGAFQLADYKDALNDLFKLNTQIVTFKSTGELKEKAKYYISHEEETRSIAESLRREVLEKHTYSIRMREMLDILNKSKIL